MASRHLDKEDRREQHCKRLNTHEARCVICEETDPRCLEEHHIAGRGYHDDTAIVCRNCHRKLSDDQLDHARDQEKPTGELATIGHFLLGVCDFLLLVLARLREFGYRLIHESRCVGGAS
jgi:hypothetical protein